MRNISLISIYSICVLAITLSLYAQPSSGSDASAVVQKYQQSVGWDLHCAMTVHCTMQITGEGSRKFNTGKRKYDFEYYRDGDHAEWSGKDILLTENDTEDRSYSEENTWVANDKHVISARRFLDQKNFRGSFGNSLRNELDAKWTSASNGCFLDGRIWLGDKGSVHIANVLAEGSRVIRNETIDGHDCEVVESSTKYGRLTAWLARDQGGNAIQYSLIRSPDNLTNGNKILREEGLKEMATMISNVKFKKIDGIFVPVEGTFIHKAIFADGSVRTEQANVIRTNVSLNPDYNALNAFLPKLPDGTILRSVDASGILFEYVHGDIRPAVDMKTISNIETAIDTLSQEKPSQKRKEMIASSSSSSSNTPIQPASTADDKDSHPNGYYINHIVIIIAGCIGVPVGVFIIRRYRKQKA